MKHPKFIYSLVGALLLHSLAHGSTSKVEVVRVPTPVSGTLTPFVIAVSGKQLTAADLGSAVAVLRINNGPVTPDSNGYRSFFAPVNADEMAIQAEDNAGNKLYSVQVLLPVLATAVTETIAEKTKLKLTFVRTSRLSIQGNTTPIENMATEWTLPHKNLPMLLSLELSSPEGISRLYNVIISPSPNSFTPSPKRIEFSTSPPSSAESAVFRVGYGLLYMNRAAVSLHGIYSKKANDHTSVLLGVQTGYQWLQRSPEVDAPWLEMGWQIRAGIRHRSDSAIARIPDEDGDDISPIQPEPVKTGPYIRSILFTLGAFSLGLRGEIAVFEPLKASSWGELNWNF